MASRATHFLGACSPKRCQTSRVSLIMTPPRAFAGERWCAIDAVGAGDQRLALAGLDPGEGLAFLEGVELERRTEFHAVVHGTLATFSHPRRDQLAFELGDRGHDVEDQAASGARGVDVLLAQADKADVVLAEAFEDVEQ